MGFIFSTYHVVNDFAVIIRKCYYSRWYVCLRLSSYSSFYIIFSESTDTKCYFSCWSSSTRHRMYYSGWFTRYPSLWYLLRVGVLRSVIAASQFVSRLCHGDLDCDDELDILLVLILWILLLYVLIVLICKYCNHCIMLYVL